MIEDVSEDESHRLCMQRWDMLFGVIEFLVKAVGSLCSTFAVKPSNLHRSSCCVVITTLSARRSAESFENRRRKDTPLVRRHEEISSSGGSSNVVSINRFDRKCITSPSELFEACSV